MIRFAGVGTIAAVALAFCSVVRADEVVLYTAPLTSGSGVNATSGRTNFAYNPAQNSASGYLFGGDASNTTDAIWSVDSVTLWVIGYTPVSATGSTAFEYGDGLTLYGGDILGGSGAAITALGTVSTGVQASYVSSIDGSTNFLSTYPSTAGEYFAVWQVTFTGLDLTLAPGADWGFALSSPSHELALNTTACPGNDANNCVSSGVIAYGPDGAQYDLAATYGNYGDVNMELDGTETPEPATFLLFGAGVGVLALVRRRRG